ncbi:MAG: glutathione S-transferase family protein [Gammaproteobacteria bacterium]|nr:glutathione S-transferase family protein [Gammaproteobacteria bacterium]
MKLYMVPVAPNPTKVMLYIAERFELGVDMGVETVMVNTLKGEQHSAAHLARNPFGTLPVLELADGSFLRESLSIIQYLEDKFPSASLLGDDLQSRAQARDLERIVETKIALPMSRYVHATNSPLGFAPNAKVAAEIEASLPKALDYVEALLEDGRSMLLGERVSIADCTLQSGCQFARFGKTELLMLHPLIAAWDLRYRERPAARKVLKF